MRKDPIRIVEAAYAPNASAAEWIDGITSAASAFDLGAGNYAYQVRFEADSFHIIAHSSHDAWKQRFSQLQSLPVAMVRELHRPSSRVLHSSTDIPRTTLPDVERSWDTGIPPVYALIGGDDRDVLVLGFKAPDFSTRLRAPDRRLLGMVVAHLGAAARLRGARGGTSAPDAWLAPSGRLLDAHGPAKEARHRGALALAVKNVERARGALRRTDPPEALRLWRALIQAEWSLVDTVESDGKRVVLARRNRPTTPQHAALTPVERAIAYYAAAGHSHKTMGYQLGLAPSTISMHLRSALVKLGLRTRAELARLYAGRG